MANFVVVATCSLNQWALDFTDNLSHIKTSIQEAVNQGARYRLGPELEICGYGCADHFYENDTFLHSWQSLTELLVWLAETKLEDKLIVDVGMPILHKNVKYNCRIILYGGRIVLIRPKMVLADYGMYRESRWFVAWTKPRIIEQYYLPRIVRAKTNQETVPFGDAVLATIDTCIGFEICEELFSLQSPHLAMGLDGVEIFVNSSASHHQIKKLHRRIDLICSATRRAGGIYLYSNQLGCDGDSSYYDGSAVISVNGELVAQGEQFSFAKVEVITAIVDLEHVRVYRSSIPSIGLQSTQQPSFIRVNVPFHLSLRGLLAPTLAIQPRYCELGRELSMGPACWLWDYLKKSGSTGFFLPLSGGMDSCAAALIVYSLANELSTNAIGNPELQSELQRLFGISVASPQQILHQTLHTCYMQSEHSSTNSKARAGQLAESIGSYHLNFTFDAVIASAINVVKAALGNFIPRFKVFGGSELENLALQNLQARLRMVLGYFCAQLLPLVRSGERTKASGRLLVLSSSNADENLCGYYTKYDCSSGDLNPIGSMTKQDVYYFVNFMKNTCSELEPVLERILSADPSAELEPLISDGAAQRDEVDLGLSYQEISLMSKLRGVYRCGPYSMYIRLMNEWKSRDLPPNQIQQKVERFFSLYGKNRHKAVTLTPAYHSQPYSPDDHRFDHRPFLYRTNWPWQFCAVSNCLESITMTE